MVARLDVPDGNEHFRFTVFQPDLVHIKRHGARKIFHGLLVRPFLQDLADAQHEHDGARRIKVAANQRNRDRRSIQHCDGKLPVRKGFHAVPDIAQRTEHCQCSRRPCGQKQLCCRATQNGKDQLVLKIPVELTRRMLRDQRKRLHLRKGKLRQRADNRFPSAFKQHDRIAGPVIDLDILHPGNIVQIILQHIRLVQRHMLAGKMDTQASGRSM